MLSMNSTQVHVLHEPDQPGFHGLLDGQQCCCLEMKVHFKVLCDFPDQSGYTQFPAQQFSASLVPSDLSECHHTWVIPMGFLDGTCKCWLTLAPRLLFKYFGRQLFLWSLPSTFLFWIRIPGPFLTPFIIIIR